MCNYEFNGILFEWDEAKERSNIEKHGIDFKAARRFGATASP